MKHFVQRNLKRFGLELRRAGTTQDLMSFLADRHIDVVLDVGANVGQFGGELRSKGFNGRIISFEPIPAVYQTLAARAGADGNWETRNFALGTKAEHTTINVANASVFSSILPSTDAAVRFDETAGTSHTETIEVRRLDDVLPQLTGNILLKIDTQGYERQVLEGGRQVLPTVMGILMELPIVHLYENTWHFHEAIKFMEEAGFVPAQIHPVNYHSADNVSLVEVDCLFRPLNRRLD